MNRYVLADPWGFECVVEVDDEGAIHGAENLCLGFEDMPAHERQRKCIEIARAAHLGNPLPYGFRRIA